MKEVKILNLVKLTNDERADVYLYDEILSSESSFGCETVSLEIANLPEAVKEIVVHINSYGGEVKEGIAIYNALKDSPAKVTTIAEGFACSIASVIFCAGDDRIVSDLSMLMIHNAWTIAVGDADELTQAAEGVRKISETTKQAYRSVCNLSDDDLKAMLDAETWLTPEESLECGFATAIKETKATAETAYQSVQQRMQVLIFKGLASEDDANTEILSKLDYVIGLLEDDEEEDEPETDDPNAAINERLKRQHMMEFLKGV